MKKITYFYVYVYLLIIKKRKKVQESITLKFCIYKELELAKLEYCVAWNLSLPSSSSMWHHKFFYELECLKLDFQSKLEFQKSGILLLILQTVVSC